MLISNKLILLLKTFSKHDLNRFKKYLASPFFNESPFIEQLYSIIIPVLLKKGKKQEESPLLKEAVWKKIFPNKPYNDIKMRRLSSDLLKQAFSFLAYNQYQSNPLREQTFLLQALNDAERSKHFEGLIKQFESHSTKNKIRDSDFHYYQQLIEHSKYEFNEKSRKSFSTKLEKTNFHLDCYYFIKKLKNYCDVLGYKNFLPIDSEIQLIPHLFEHLEKEDFLAVPNIKAFYLVAKMFLHPQEETYFFQLKALLQDFTSTFSKADLSILYTHLMNYCIHKKINIGKSEFYQELFELYQITLQIFVNEGKEKLDLHRYKNMVTVGLQVKKYKWVENFIQVYTNSLDKEHRENALTYNLAKVYFYQKKYNQVIEQLSAVKYKNHIYALGGKLLLLKTYFELKEFIALDSLIDSFRIYIRRNKLISREVKQQYLNMLRFVKKLSNIMPGDKKALDKVRLNIDKCKALAGKKWILEKLEELQ
jgi:hypothetical protein